MQIVEESGEDVSLTERTPLKMINSNPVRRVGSMPAREAAKA
jgi:hypothetical protein